MRLRLCYISPRDRMKSTPAQALVTDFVARAQRYTPTTLQGFRSELELLAHAASLTSRARPIAVLLDSRGRQLSSDQFAGFLGGHRDAGAQEVLLAIGPADGWSFTGRARADLLLSLGAFTLPHELALVVLAEQTYRALTILAGHPYHSGHATE